MEKQYTELVPINFTVDGKKELIDFTNAQPFTRSHLIRKLVAHVVSLDEPEYFLAVTGVV